MNSELDIYFLPESASIEVVKKFIDNWAWGLEEPSEYCIHLEDESELYCDCFDDFLNYITSHDKVSSSLYWTKDHDPSQRKDVYIGKPVSAVFVFFNKDNSIILGVGATYIEDNETLDILDEINNSFAVVAAFITLGPPPDSKGSFIDVAMESRPPKITRGLLMNK